MSAVPFRTAVAEWLKIGLLSFGGPAGQIALMHRRLVDERKWIDDDRFQHALNYCMLLPGPEAQQLAVYVGWLLHGWRGGLVAGTLFVLPGALAIFALSAVYVTWGGVASVEAAFMGLRAAVVAIVLDAVVRIARKAFKGPGHVALAAGALVAIFFYEVPFPAVVLAAALVGWMGSRHDPAPAVTASAPPTVRRALRVLLLGLFLWWAPVAALAAVLGPGHLFVSEALFFSWTAVITFGGAYAVLAYVAQVVVEGFRWLTTPQMVHGLGLAETTPGPLILVLQFVGFLAAYRNPGALHPLLAGAIGSAITLWVTFVPCFLWIFLGAPYVEAARGRQGLSGALAGITAAVVGVILNLSLWFAMHSLFGTVDERRVLGARVLAPDFATADLFGCAVAAASLLILLRFRRALIPVVLGAAALGALRHWAA